MHRWAWGTWAHYFLLEELAAAKAYVEGGGGIAAILLLDHQNVDRSSAEIEEISHT
jgi:hypothetical protein